MAQPRLSKATRGLDSQLGGGGGGKIEDRHILIIAMSEHHVDYMNRKGGHSVIMQGGHFADVYIRKHGLVHGARVLANYDFYC